MTFESSSVNSHLKGSYDSSDLHVSDLDENHEPILTNDYNMNFEEDSLRRHFYDQYLDVDAEIKRLKLDIENLEQDKKDSILDFKREYREVCHQLQAYKENQEKKQSEYEQTLLLMQTQRKAQEETITKQYSEELEKTKLQIKYNQQTSYDLKQKMTELKIENETKIDKLNCAIVDIDTETKLYEDEIRTLESKNTKLLAKQKALREALEQARNENQIISEKYRKEFKKFSRIQNEVNELQVTSKI